MKIKERSDLTTPGSSRDILQQEALRTNNAKDAATLAKKIKAETEGTLLGGKYDSVDVSLAKAISAELSPEAMVAERRSRVEKLKQLVAEGNYNPSSEAVARAVGEEIMYEIFGAQGATTEG
jgi:anti-sigma28 factor (negative regulator of flagellin synthesis)